MKTLLRTFALILVLTTGVQAADIHIVSSGGFAAAYKTLAPVYEQQTGNTLVAAWGPSMGDTPDTVPSRLKRGENIDVVIMVGYALGDLIKQGKVLPDSRVDLAKSGIGIAARQGAPHPDTSTVAALKQTLLAAKSIAYSDSASGVYISTQMFKMMGIADQVVGKAHMIPAEPVGGVVARDDAEIGFQQLSELKPIKGIDVLGPLPAELQKYTIFSGGVVVKSEHPKEAEDLLHFLASTSARSAVIDSGMTPVQ